MPAGMLRSKLSLLSLSLALLAGCESATGSELTAPVSSTAVATSEATAASTTVASSSATVAASQSPAADAAPEGMVVIPEGLFMMGGQSEENTPIHEVAIARFYLDETEVTVAAYEPCVKSGACKAMQTNNPFCNSLFSDRAKHPVNCIDWNDADAYCKSVGKRLPTEREWEYVAKAGSEQRLYAWGMEEPDPELSCYRHNGGTCEVATHPKAAFGLYDITGNVWEWTSSWYAPYPNEATQGKFKVYRGGSWSRRFAKWMRGDLRNRYEVHEQSASVGVRCAKDFARLTCPAGSRPEGGVCLKDGTTAPQPVALTSGKPLTGTLPVGSATAMASAPSASASVRPEDKPITRGRAPGFDADCAKHYPGMPVAYQWSNGTFQAREPLIAGAGCKKRDIGVGWSSACCPN